MSPSTQKPTAVWRSLRSLDLDTAGDATPAFVHLATSLLVLVISVVTAVLCWAQPSSTQGRLIAISCVVVIAPVAAVDWWWLKRHGGGTRGAFVAPLIWAVVTLSNMWWQGPATYVWAMVAMGILFVRLPFFGAIIGASSLLAGAVFIVAVRWQDSPLGTIRMVLSGVLFIGIVVITRYAFDSLVLRLRTVSRLLRDTIESIDQGIEVLDQDGVVVLHNRRASEMLTTLSEPLDGGPLHARDVSAFLTARGDLPTGSELRVRDVMASGVAIVDEETPTRDLRPWGEDRWVEMSMGRTSSGFTVRSLVDVTEYVESRRVVEQISTARAAFLSSLSHECRTPMNAVLGLSRLALQDEPDGERRESLLTLEAAAQHLQLQLGDLIELAAIESGAESIRQAVFSLPDLIERAVATSRRRVAGRDLEVQADVSPDLVDRFVGDGPRIEHVLTMLLRQAEQSTVRGRIHVQAVGEWSAYGRRQVRVTVHNTGRGMAQTADGQPSHLSGDSNQRDPNVDGALGGLGTVRRYAEMLGGAIGFRAGHGGGMTVWFSLPLPLEAGGEAPAYAPHAGRPGPVVSRDVDVPDQTPLDVPGTVPPSSATADADDHISSAERVEKLSEEIAARWETLNTLPYRTWLLACAVAVVTAVVLPLIQVLALWNTPGSIPYATLLFPLPVGVSGAVMLVRHRRLNRPFRRDALLNMVVGMVCFGMGLHLNGGLTLLLMPTAIISIYIVHPRRTARIATAVLLLAAVALTDTANLLPAAFIRIIFAAVVSCGLMEWILWNLRKTATTLEMASANLRSLSLSVVRDNARLTEVAGTAGLALADRAKLLAAVSHEIRTPLNAVLGLSRLISDEPLSPRQKEWMERIRDSGQYLLRLVSEILDVSRMESGLMRLAKDPFELESVFNHVVDVLRREGMAKGLRTVIDVSPEVTGSYLGDRTRLTQLLLNLVGNAVKYTEQGEVAFQVERLPGTGDGVRLRFVIRDTGIGLSAEQQARLFRPFEQLEGSAFSVDGFGLGLSICKGIADAMGGLLTVTSSRGMGSTFAFEVSLPQAEAPRALSPTMLTSGHAQHVRGARVLVVDDHRVNRDVTGELLRRSGVVVHLAEDGEAAITAVRRCKPDLVLMDINMPVLDGPEATRQLRQIEEFRDLPIIALTAAAFAADEARCRAAGMSDVITKPVELETLLHTVAKWLPEGVRGLAGDDVGGFVSEAISSDDVIQRLSDVYGLDAVGGLRRMSNDQALYLTLLGNSLNRYGNDVDHIARALADGHFDDARMLTHALNGAAGTLGATRVHRAARALEASLHEGAGSEAIMEALGRLREEFEPFVASLRRALDREAAARDATIPPSTAEESRHAMDTFLVLLSASNADAFSMLCANRDLLHPLDASDRQVITELTESLDLKAAAAHLRGALARMA